MSTTTTSNMNTTENLPAKANLAILVKSLLPESGYWAARYGEPIADNVFATEAEAEEYENATEAVPVSVCLTVGWTPETGGWHYQTGDNSYTGGAYGHAIWAVVWITSDSIPDEVADEILNELADQSL